MNSTELGPKFNNGEFESKLDKLDVLVAELTSNESLKAMPPTERNQIIADVWIGALARKGEITDSNGEAIGVGEILMRMDLMGSDADLNLFTRNNKLRLAVKMLTDNGIQSESLGGFSNRIGKDAEGNAILTNPDQISSYVSYGDNKIEDPNGQMTFGTDWVNRIIASASSGEWVDDPRGRDSLAASDNEYLRQQGNRIANDQKLARMAGLDLDLLARSSSYIRENNKQEG